jgi:phospholipid transport system substrate-binding protein
MRTIARLTVFLAAVWAFAPWVHAQSQGPDALVKKTVEDLLNIIRSDKEVQAGNVERIAKIMQEKVAPHFDFPRMTRLAVGRSWREATAEQREALIKEFRELLIRSYAAAFTFYKGIAVEYKPFRMNDGDQEATVNTVLKLPGGAQPIAVDYDMAQSDGAWKVYDVRIDGASLVINYRNLFSQEIQRGGIEGLLKSLQDKNLVPSPTAAKK